MRSVFINGLVVMVSILVALGIAEFALRSYAGGVSAGKMDPGLIRYDKQLGWTLTPGWSGEHTHADYKANYAVSGSGLRDQGVIGRDRPVLVVGDSFTFGLGVNDHETFVAQLNQQGQGSFLNGAVPGYSPKQVMLRDH